MTDMSGEKSHRSSGKYAGNIKRTMRTIGATLFAATLLGLAAELWLRGAEAPAVQQPTETLSIWPSVSLAFAATRIAIPVIGALVVVPLLASRLIHKLHATGDLEEAHNAINRIAFGKLGRRPYVMAREGRITHGEDSFAGRVGGPATLIVFNDTAVVTEQYGRTKRILGAGRHELERYEKVWETIDLRPQHWVYAVYALTKEGIPVCCEADLTFQIEDRPAARSQDQQESEPYPYSEDAVFLAATNKWIREPDHPEPVRTWAGRVVISYADGMLRDILAGYRLDWLIAPPQPGQQPPREEIRQRLEEELRRSIGRLGARMLSVRIGKIEVKTQDEETTRQLVELTSKQWIETWHADLEARALVSRAEGEAELLRMDTARLQAQAEMVVTLTEALQTTIAKQGQVQPYIMALRFLEALRWMTYNTYAHEFMPPEAMRTLKRLQATLEGKPLLPEEEVA